MVLNQLSPSIELLFGSHPHCWMPPPKGCLKLNINASFKNNSTTLAVLASDEVGKAQGLWFEKAHFSLVFEVKVEAIFHACDIAKDKLF